MLRDIFVSTTWLPSSSSSGSCSVEDVVDESLLLSLFSRSNASEGCCGGSSCDAIFYKLNRHNHEMVRVEFEVVTRHLSLPAHK